MSAKIEKLEAEKRALEARLKAAKKAEAEARKNRVLRLAEKAGILDLDDEFLAARFRRIAEEARTQAVKPE